MIKIRFDTRGESLNSHASLEPLATACALLEQGLYLLEDELMTGFMWMFASYSQYYALLHIYKILTVCAVGDDARKAWHVAERDFARMCEDDLQQIERKSLVIHM